MSKNARISPRLQELLVSQAGLSDEEFLWYEDLLQVRTLAKKEHLLRAGEIASWTAYVNRGCVRRYVIDEHGKEITVDFALEDWWTGDLESFLHDKSSAFYIQSIEESEILLLTRTKFDLVCRELPKYKALHDSKVERNHYATLKRLTIATSGTQEEKYLHLMEELPQLFQRIPLHYIASYLGIEPESLSRLRKRIAQKNRQ